jgi:FkbM family methyltransferase
MPTTNPPDALPAPPTPAATTTPPTAQPTPATIRPPGGQPTPPTIAATRPLGARLTSLTQRYSHLRAVRAGAYKLGEALGDRVLVGRTPGGSPMALSMRDHHHRAIYFLGEHEPEITALFRRLLTPGATVYDVGANAGYFSVLACELGSAAVHAFEPNPRIRALLEHSARLGGSAIEVVAAACGEREGTAALRLSDPANTGMTSLADDGEGIAVALVTLDGYAERTGTQPDLVKIDVEGQEREVLAGASRLLRDARPIVIAEIGSEATLRLMTGHGYSAHRILGDGTTVAHDGRLRLVGGYENVCFLPSSSIPRMRPPAPLTPPTPSPDAAASA